MARRPKMRRTLRKFVYERDGYACRYCGWKPTQIPDDYRGLNPIAEVVGYERKVVYRRMSWTDAPDVVEYADVAVLKRLEVDHVVPLVRGGAFDDPNNLQALCSDCNNRKGARL